MTDLMARPSVSRTPRPAPHCVSTLKAHGWDDRVVALLRRFGPETPETAFVARLFYFDGDLGCAFANQPSDWDTETRHALVDLFGGGDDGEDGAIASLRRWRHATRNLLALVGEPEDGRPWLYAWVMFGVLLCARLEALERHAWNEVMRATATARHRLGVEFADELPLELGEARRRWDDRSLRELELELAHALLGDRPHTSWRAAG